MSRPVLFLVNRLSSLEPSQSTFHLAVTCAARREVFVAGIRELVIEPDGRVHARAHRVQDGQVGEEMTNLTVHDCAVWVRLNPGRVKQRWASSYALEALSLVRRRGGLVLNQPTGLWSAMSKTSLMSLPRAARPVSFVSPDPDRIAAWVCARKGASVIKPTLGTHGVGVQKVDASTPDLVERATALCEDGPVIAQAYLGRAPEGDVRIHMVDGHPLMVGGKRGIVRRVPPEGDFRSNVKGGGRPVAAKWNEELAKVAELCGPTLRRLGLWHVGLDVVGTKVVEVNAFSPGGLQDAGEFMGVDFVTGLVDAFLERAD